MKKKWKRAGKPEWDDFFRKERTISWLPIPGYTQRRGDIPRSTA
jgi:hypothetical protein